MAFIEKKDNVPRYIEQKNIKEDESKNYLETP